MVDLSKSIKINNHYKITYGRLLLVIIISVFQFLGITAGNGWIPPAEAFFLVANTFMLLERRAEEDEEAELLEKVLGKVDKLTDRVGDLENGNNS